MEEFSYLIKSGQIKDQAHEYRISADESQRQALAKRFDLVEIARLEGCFRLQHEHSGIIAARLKLYADITQICVVTLDPFSEHIEDAVDLRFVPAPMLNRLADASDDEEEIALDSFDSPDEIAYEHDQIDLGAVLSEQLALVLNPYPRKPGAALPDTATDTPPHPFAALVDKFGKKAL